MIQARDGATRYRDKTTKGFCNGKSIIEILINKLKDLEYPIIISTTNKSPRVIHKVYGYPVTIHIGQDGKVLERYYQIIKEYDLDGVFRVCADNPFLQLSLLYPIKIWAETGDYDYVSWKNAMHRHEGFYCEYVSSKAITVAHHVCKDERMRENVTEYIYTNPKKFKIKELDIPEELKEEKIRLTVDTESDFFIAKEIYNNIENDYWMKIIEYCHKHPKLLKEMKKNIEENPKQ